MITKKTALTLMVALFCGAGIGYAKGVDFSLQPVKVELQQALKVSAKR